MLSENIMLYNTDSHPIYDKSTGKIINYDTSKTHLVFEEFAA